MTASTGGGHSHDHAPSGSRSRLLIVMLIIGTVLVAEVIGGILSGSLALLADAGHMLSDFISLVVAFVASTLALRPANDRRTFGSRRAEVFGALINGTLLLVVTGFVAYEAIERLITGDGETIEGGLMLMVAIVGLVANVAGIFVLRGGASDSINMRGAYLEVLNDTLGSVAVIVAAVIVMTTGFRQADAIASLLIAVLIVPRAIGLLREVFQVLGETAPADTDVAEIRRHILSRDGVVAVHDVHVWSITAGLPVFTAHVVVEPAVFEQGRADELLDRLSECLNTHFDVEHSTFQLEPAGHAAHEGDRFEH